MALDGDNSTTNTNRVTRPGTVLVCTRLDSGGPDPTFAKVTYTITSPVSDVFFDNGTKVLRPEPQPGKIGIKPLRTNRCDSLRLVCGAGTFLPMARIEVLFEECDESGNPTGDTCRSGVVVEVSRCP